jgi:hypothetical protein
MAVPVGPTEKRYTGNGITKIFTIPFLLLESGDLDVFIDGVEIFSGFTITGVGNPTSTITFISAPPNLASIFLNLNVPFQRLNDYQENGDFLASTVNRDFDRIWQALKQLLGYSRRALTLGAADVDGSGAYRAKGNKISDLSNPVDPQDAVTKSWVSMFIDSISGAINTTVGIAYDAGTLFDYLRTGVARQVDSIAALKQLSASRNQRAKVLGYYLKGDSGGGEYYADLTDSTSLGNDATIVVGNDGTRWKLSSTTLPSVKQYGAKGDGATDDTARLQKVFGEGGAIRLNSGTFLTSAALTIDYSTDTSDGVSTSFLGYLSKRYSIIGDSWSNTIIVATGNDYALKCLGSFPVTQNFSGVDSIENLTITNPARNVPNTTNTGASGLFVSTKAYTNIKRYTARNLKLGLHLDSVLTSKIEDVLIEGCYQGLRTTSLNGASGPNSMIWSKVKVGGSTTNGIVAEVGAGSHFDTITVEGNGTHATNSCGMILTIPASQMAGVITFTQPYFELNAGAADLIIDNQSTFPATVIIEGGVFARAGALYTSTNIQAQSSGGGALTVLLKGVHFLSVSGYTPSAARPFWKTDSAVCKVIPDEYCTYNETTSLVGSKRFALTTPLVINAAGVILGGDATSVTCSNTATGQYTFTCVAGSFGLSATDYSVVATPADSTPTGFSTAQSIRFQPITASSFALNCFNGATPVNTPLSLQICGARYSI